MQDKDLDQLLALAAATPPDASPALIDRVLADALALQPAAPGRAALQPRQTRPGFLVRLSGLFGGAPGLAGVAGAALVGIAVGYLNPASMDALAGGLTDTGTEEFFPAVDFLTTEG